MEKADNEMYALVDEEFLAKFSNQHLNYMKKLYYSFYAGYCKRIKHRLTRAHREKQLKMSCQALHNAPPNRT